MLDWKFRILLFTRNMDSLRFGTDKFQILRHGKNSLEVDLRFQTLEGGLEYISALKDLDEIIVFVRGESLLLGTPSELKNGIVEGFNLVGEEKYWLAHELFEDYWKHFQDHRSKFFHGVVLLCVSMVHFQMDHKSNAERLFGEAKKELIQFLEGTESWQFSYPLDYSILEKIRDRSIRIIQD